ncbi:hypothetical protein N3K66_000835 [Trichothecium roseum]|uniref:Uncharacterized protein n=1 Tax=Trichothecium roseum TaxID=47278 RepID=A0ACC0VD07_9HYPO|nr:hypothetical protein N3K66_000835 [Trichothecium roseum]
MGNNRKSRSSSLSTPSLPPMVRSSSDSDTSTDEKTKRKITNAVIMKERAATAAATTMANTPSRRRPPSTHYQSHQHNRTVSELLSPPPPASHFSYSTTPLVAPVPLPIPSVPAPATTAPGPGYPSASTSAMAATAATATTPTRAVPRERMASSWPRRPYMSTSAREVSAATPTNAASVPRGFSTSTSATPATAPMAPTAPMAATPQKAATPRTTASSSLLQPRLAVVLNVPPPWHPWLFALRLSSILPAVWWGLPSILHLVVLVLGKLLVMTSVGGRYNEIVVAAGEEGGVMEATLASIWCFASGYLSFFFTDCLMSRWLINYTPQAVMIRLITTDAINAYLTSAVLSLAGGFQDPRLLLPGWIGIATTLTLCYHIIYQKINIRKETSTSINVFSIASYLSMLVLLAHLHTYQPDYTPVPLVTWARQLWTGMQSFLAAQLGNNGGDRTQPYGLTMDNLATRH